MVLFLFPEDRSQYLLSYNRMIIGILMGSSLVVAFTDGPGSWLPFIVAVFMTLFWYWDLVFRPWMYPESEEEETPQNNDLGLSEFVKNATSKEQLQLTNQVRRMGEEIQRLKDTVKAQSKQIQEMESHDGS